MPNHPKNLNIFRAIDANANRCQEALRVIEDCLRFVLEDRHLAKLTKNLRHQLRLDWDRHCTDASLAARDSAADVGRHQDTESEYHRVSIADVMQANFARAQQSMRCLEEFFKLSDPQQSQLYENLRYEIYALEKAALTTSVSLDRLKTVRLYVLTDAAASLSDFQERVQQLIAGGVDAIQLRDKQQTDRTLLERSRLLAELCREKGVLSIINDRPDLASMARADGVHLGQDDVGVHDARRWLGEAAVIGVSSHSIQQARQAVLSGANYLGVGPTFQSQTKKFEQLSGTDLLRKVAAEIALPSFAIGGIHGDNLDQVLATGMSRIAVSEAVLKIGTQTEQNARQLKARLDPARTTITS